MFDSRWERCKNRASRPLQGTVNGGAVSKWPRCRWDVKHNQPTNQHKNYLMLIDWLVDQLVCYFGIEGHATLDRNIGLGYNTLLLWLTPGYLNSVCPHRQSHTLPSLKHSLAALPNSSPNAWVPSREAVSKLLYALFKLSQALKKNQLIVGISLTRNTDEATLQHSNIWCSCSSLPSFIIALPSHVRYLRQKLNIYRERKSLRTLQNRVRINVVLVQLTLFVNMFVAFKKCIIQWFSTVPSW